MHDWVELSEACSTPKPAESKGTVKLEGTGDSHILMVDRACIRSLAVQAGRRYQSHTHVLVPYSTCFPKF